MPRTSRRQSSTGIYHVRLTGVAPGLLFRDREDHEKFLAFLRQCRTLSGFELYAYCLTDSGAQLLMKEGSEPMGTVFKRLAGRYVYWYNLKYQRTGPLFQGRFKSEPVEDESHFLAALRYIHRRPAAEGLEAKAGTYPWSSFSCYSGWPDGITDPAFAVRLVGSREELQRYLTEPGDDGSEDAPPRRTGVTDEAAMAIAAEICGCGSEAEFRSLERPVREAYIRQLYDRGLSLRQLAQLAGISKTGVTRIVRT